MKKPLFRGVAASVATLLCPPALLLAAARPDVDAVQRALDQIGRNPAAYGLAGRDATLSARSVRTDARGTSHVRIDQFYRGVPVFEGEAIAHVGARGEVQVTSALRSIRGLSVVPRITRDDAVALAVAEAAPQGHYRVDDVALQVLPRGERSAANRLVWHVSVTLENPYQDTARWELFYDAHAGSLVFSYDALETGRGKGKPGGGGGGGGSAATGTGRTMYSGNQAIGLALSSGTYTLQDPTRGSGNYTCDQNNRQGGKCNKFSNSTGIFGNNSKDNTDRGTAAADAHFGLQSTWDYYKNAFGRNGIDGNGRTTYSRVHYGTNYQNAYWSDSCFCMTYGDGGSVLYPLVSLDVAGHEMSHGVLSTEANLTYSGESGGLNESNSDIFGTMVEFAVNSPSDTPDYWIGEVLYKSNWSGGNYSQNTALRFMDDPHKDGTSPACWSSSVGSLDVHYSSGPNNHMFYLLAEGGTSKCNGNSVSGIGRTKAARIWYEAITNYMTSSTNYHGARTAALNAATSLYGAGSAEYNAVAAAFAAINVQ